MRVTVVVAVRDGEGLVGEAVASVYAQAHDRVSLVVVDDGSSDGTWAAVRAATGSQKFPTSAFRLDEAAGQGRARNVAVAAAREYTDVFAFLDADDLFAPGKVASAVARFAADPEHVGLVYADESHEDSVLGRRYHRFREPFDYGRLLGSDTVGGSFLVARWALDRFGGFDESMAVAECYDLALRVSARSAAVHVAEPLTTVRVGPGALRHAVPAAAWAAHESYARGKAGAA